MAKRVQHRRGKRLPPNTRLVTRLSRWGNPWPVGKPGPDGRVAPDAAGAVGFFVDMLADPERRAMCRYPSDADIRRHLRGSDLACACDLGAPCHADTLLMIANTDGSDADR